MRAKPGRLWQGIFEASGAKILTLALGLLSLSLTARWLGPEGRGIVAALSTWALLAATLGHGSLGQIAIHHAVGRPAREWLADALGSLVLVTLLVTVVTFLVFGLLYGIHRSLFGGISPALLLLGFSAVPFLIWEQYASSLLMATDRIGLYNRGQVYGRLLALVAVLVAVPVLSLGIAGAVVAVILGQAITALFGTWQLWRLAELPVRPRLASLKRYVLGGLKLHLNAISTILFVSAEILILQYYRGASETGLYQLAHQLGMILLVLPQSVGMIFYGQMVRDGVNASWEGHRKALWKLSGLVLAAMAAAALLAPWGIPLIAGAAFRPSVGVFQILLLTIPAKALSIALAPQWIGRGLFLPASLITLGIGALNTGLCLLLVPAHGMNGALAASLIASAPSLLINFIMIRYFSGKARAGTSNEQR